MANKEHLEIIKQGVASWNEWRKNNPKLRPDLSDTILSGYNLSGADLSDAALYWSWLTETNLSNANLSGADLMGASLFSTDLSNANLSSANLDSAIMVRTNFENANLTGCRIYGISAWDLELQGTVQLDLIITPHGDPAITVDNLEVAQFIYLLLNNEKLRDVIDTITSKVVLILGRFNDKQKPVLDAVRNELRKHNYLPVMFDFEKPASRDLTETVSTLAHIARFIIADITEPRSIPQELQAIIPNLAVPIQPLILEGSTGEYAMFQDLKRKYHWVLTTHQYNDLTCLLESLEEKVIVPAEKKVQELRTPEDR